MKLALLFSGQGAQKPGMGVDFLSDPLFKKTIAAANEASGHDIETIFRSKKGELNQTVYVQPALVAFEAGLCQMLQRDLPHLPVAGMVGLSLGEYSAMFASGALDLKNTISLVSDRARYMQADADKVQNGMAALLQPQLTSVKKIVSDLQDRGQQVYLANYNSPAQVVIAGEKAAVEQAVKEIKQQKAARRAIKLRVNGAFHTPLFNSARGKMKKRLRKVAFSKAKVPVISNTTGKPFTKDWQSVMARQLAVPTHFDQCLQYLIDHQQIDATLEIGPGHTLSSFAKQIDSQLKRYQIGSLAEYKSFVEAENGFKK